MRYGRLACHGGPDDSLTRARDGAHPAHMIPAVIGVVLVILLWASLVADGEEDERREAAGDGEPSSWSWRSRVGVMAGTILLMPLGLIFAFPEILFTDGPAWWWAWLAGAVAYVAFLVVAEAEGLRMALVLIVVSCSCGSSFLGDDGERRRRNEGRQPSVRHTATPGNPPTTRRSFTATSGRSSASDAGGG